MRPVCLLDRTKNLHQFDGLYFISTSQRIFFARTSAENPPHSLCYASGFPPRSDEKIYANLRDCFISDSLKIRQSPYFFAGAPKNMPASSYCGAITILPLWSM